MSESAIGVVPRGEGVFSVSTRRSRMACVGGASYTVRGKYYGPDTMPPHVAAPVAIVLIAASATAAGLALLGRHAEQGGPGGGVPAEEAPQDLIMVTTAILGALGAGLTVAISAQNVVATHHARARRYEERLAADAAAAVAGVAAEYVAPLRRDRLAAFLRADPFESCRPGVCEIQYLGRLYVKWSLALRLTEPEGEEALERSIMTLAEEYPRLGADQLARETRKALAASREKTPSTMSHLIEFISRTRSGSLSVVRGATPPMSRSTTPA